VTKKDVIVEEVRRVRHELVKKHGGLDGWIRHLQELDRKRGRRSYQRSPGKRSAKVSARK
jgi:hypothetical protein